MIKTGPLPSRTWICNHIQMENLHISQGVFQIVRFRTYHIPSLAASLPRAFILIRSHLKADDSRVHMVSPDLSPDCRLAYPAVFRTFSFKWWRGIWSYSVTGFSIFSQDPLLPHSAHLRKSSLILLFPSLPHPIA